MKRTILAAMFAAAAVAPAAAQRPVVIGIDGTCNIETITRNGPGVPSSMRETSDGCDENIGVGGFKMKVKGVGKTAGFSWNSSSAPGKTFSVVLAYPYRTGNTLTFYYTADGVTQSAVTTTYTVLDNAALRSAKAGTRPITSRLLRR
jgi:hypothetical protein